MAYEITVRRFPPRLLAVYPTHATRATLGRVITGSPVWAFIGKHKIANTGHNVVVYRKREGDPSPAGAFAVEVGVEVLAPFAAAEGIVNATTPDGLAASTCHTGPYDRMAAGYDALSRWAAENGRPLADVSWEVYGHWNDDPAKLETDLFVLLREQAGP